MRKFETCWEVLPLRIPTVSVCVNIPKRGLTYKVESSFICSTNNDILAQQIFFIQSGLKYIMTHISVTLWYMLFHITFDSYLCLFSIKAKIYWLSYCMTIHWPCLAADLSKHLVVNFDEIRELMDRGNSVRLAQITDTIYKKKIKKMTVLSKDLSLCLGCFI